MKRYNIHGHVFDFECVPERFIPLLSKRILSSEKRLKRWVKMLKWANPFTSKDDIEKFSRFIETMGKTQEEVFNSWTKPYSDEFMFNILPMDLRWMGAGKVKKDYLDQLLEAVKITRQNRNAMLSVMIDPRAEDIDEIYAFCKGFASDIVALKLYPLLGYTVNHPNIDRFYRLAELNGWGIIVHGTPENAVHCRNRREVNRTMPRGFEGYKKGLTLKKKCGNYAHPYHIIEAAKKWDVNFDIAHFHGDWRDIIIQGMYECKNLYSDISFTFNEPKEMDNLSTIIDMKPILEDRLLFGDDMYMILTQDQTNPFVSLPGHLTKWQYNKLTVENPIRFLKKHNNNEYKHDN